METLAQSNSGYKQNAATHLSSAEVQAMLALPREHFKRIESDAAIRAGSKIFRVPETTVEGWRQLSGSDSQNVFVCLLAHLNEWADGLELARTPNGGFQKMLNVRLLELGSGKCDRGGRKTDEHGTEFPCLEDFGLSICCAMIRGPQERSWSYFRICHLDEVLRRDGKKVPYKPAVSSRPTPKGTRKAVPIQPQPEPQPEPQPQSSMFDTSNFVSYETGGRR